MSDMIIFEADTRQVEVLLEGETLWITQSQMAELFATSADNISLHLKNVYKDNELYETATAEDFSVVRQEGVRQVARQLKHYNLDAIISVGYRVNSTQATRFEGLSKTARCERDMKHGQTRKFQRARHVLYYTLLVTQEE